MNEDFLGESYKPLNIQLEYIQFDTDALLKPKKIL